ncbi:glycoside hydrolase family 172 protein [Jiangella asiatica]|uniref:DUF2961 domain-containing protein n=1 Tax=Jiangella asiatica TaxID=2530372 RepID=A0A4R5DBU9_9ACTN|nr:glycoside hydrolase family 172 protein [Jiangella asiatica]TDE08015.1 DUF2961 domain-containing protein [Jiangella asiatica]
MSTPWFNGLGTHLGNLSRLSGARTRSISAENPSGAPGGGGRAERGTHSTAYASRELPRGWKKAPCIDLRGKETYTIADIDGPGAVQHIWITTLPKHWRRIVLRCHWDGEENPSIEVPLGDFFCQGWTVYAPVSSLPVTVAPAGGLNCYWEMPFRQHARITVENVGPDTIEGFFYQITYALTDVPDDAAYLHAQWRRSDPLEYQQPHVLLDGVRGQGHYVGTYLAWEAHHTGWWGEGEIKFFLDDDEFPTICGTGTEDYFGGAWAFEDPPGQYAAYSTPYLGMPQVIRPDGFYDNQPRFGLYRWHVADPIRFTSALRVQIQALGFRTPTQGQERYLPRRDDIASTSWWYQTEPHTPFPAFPGMDALDTV